ncbi:GntR family transcriptional regulator [Brevundimonas sp. BH3]|uniref:GntR family transcriptional regulator n=1 Tax=Brevundimonas sp. BH3 TaxID=3133089 RepID=UPI00324DDD57
MREPTLAEKVADELTHRIIIGQLKAGERLRQEEFAHEFSTSHVPIREAFLRLEIRRLAISEPRRGVRVAPLESHDALEIVRMRGALEVMALRIQKGRPNTRQLAKVREALKAGDEAADLIAWEAANRAFHTALAELSLMPRLVSTVADLNIAFSRQVFAKMRSDDWKPRSNHDHQRIYDALCGGDIDAAVNLLENHIWAGERYPSQMQVARG